MAISKAKKRFPQVALGISILVIIALAAFAVIAQDRREEKMEKQMDMMAEKMGAKMMEHCQKMMADGGMAKMMSGSKDSMPMMGSAMSNAPAPQPPEGMTLEEHLSHHQ